MRAIFKFLKISILVLVTIQLVACGDNDPQPGQISVLSATINGSTLSDGSTEIALNSELEIVFSTSLNTASFLDKISLTGGTSDILLSPSFSSNSSRVSFSLDLEPETNYQLVIQSGALGSGGEVLSGQYTRSFTTQSEGIITSQPPCLGGASCLRTFEIASSGRNFNVYSNYNILETNAQWVNLETAIIVVHGINRNGSDYFSWVTSSLEDLNLSDEILLIAPQYKISTEAASDDLYWSSTGWREGYDSQDPAGISSFEVMDEIMELLADETHFPNLNRVIVTGHSSGGLFTHVYGAANTGTEGLIGKTVQYVVANSQYFYYPDGERINESNGSLYTPAGCGGYDIWPLGFNVTPPYVTAVGKSALDAQYVDRSITYLLGNGSEADPTLNTSDCAATLLGSTRFIRGEHVYDYMNLKYMSNGHQKVIVNGIGHNGQAMYQSTEFKTLLQTWVTN